MNCYVFDEMKWKSTSHSINPNPRRSKRRIRSPLRKKGRHYYPSPYFFRHRAHDYTRVERKEVFPFWEINSLYSSMMPVDLQPTPHPRTISRRMSSPPAADHPASPTTARRRQQQKQRILANNNNNNEERRGDGASASASVRPMDVKGGGLAKAPTSWEVPRKLLHSSIGECVQKEG
jgi:hypothetical protein